MSDHRYPPGYIPLTIHELGGSQSKGGQSRSRQDRSGGFADGNVEHYRGGDGGRGGQGGKGGGMRRTRGGRPEGNGPRGDRGEDRGNRGDRSEDRGNRGDREDRGNRGDRDGNRGEREDRGGNERNFRGGDRPRGGPRREPSRRGEGSAPADDLANAPVDPFDDEEIE